MALYSTVGTVTARNAILASEYNTVASALNQILSLFAGGTTESIDLTDNPTTYYAPVSGEPSVGTLHMLSNRTNGSDISFSSPTAATSILSSSALSKVPNGTKMIRCRMSAKPGASMAYYYIEFKSSDNTQSFPYHSAVGSHDITATWYDHYTVDIPIGTDGKFYLYWNGSGTTTMTNISLTILGYYI